MLHLLPLGCYRISPFLLAVRHIILDKMFCCLKRLPKTKRPDGEVHKDPAHYVKSQEIQYDVPLQPSVPIGSRVGNPPDAVPTVTEPDPLLHRSSDSNKSGMINLQQTELPLRTATPSVLGSEKLDMTVCVPAKRSRDLWKEAFAELDDEEKDLLSKVEKPEGLKIVEEVEKQTKARYREHEERGWKIPRGKGKNDISLRDAARKILSSVLWAKDLIDRLVAFDLTGYASIAWSIVSFGLQMVKNDIDRVESMFEACRTLTDTLTLCAAIDASHRDQDMPDSCHLEEAIIGIYVVILKFSTEILRESTMKNGQRIVRSITSLEEQPLQEFIKTLYSKEKVLNRWAQLIQHQYRKGEMEGISRKAETILAEVEDLAEKISNIESRAFTNEEDKILGWFSKYRFFESQREASLRRDSSTPAQLLGSWTRLSTRSGRNRIISCCGFMEIVSNCLLESTSLTDPSWMWKECVVVSAVQRFT